MAAAACSREHVEGAAAAAWRGERAATAAAWSREGGAPLRAPREGPAPETRRYPMAEFELGFGRQAERQVALQTFNSTFCILVDLRHKLTHKLIESEQSQESKEAYEKYADKVTDIEADLVESSSETGQRNCTGFAIYQEENKLRILTCAHALDDVYTKNCHGVTCDDINKMFRFQVYCLHQEKQVEARRGKTSMSERRRVTTLAMAVAVDTKRDLMMLEVDTSELHLRGQGANKVSCTESHPPIKLATSNPNQCDKVILLGWAPNLSQSQAPGQVNSCDREYDCITSLNLKGYECRFLLAHGLVCDKGWSGGPVLDGDGHLVGVYHGSSEGTGYAVSRTDVEIFLRENGMEGVL